MYCNCNRGAARCRSPPEGEEIGPKSMTIPLLVGTKVRFRELYRPPQVRGGTIRFGDFITPWIEAWQLERVS
jgi:hypothetical protein